MGADRFNRVGAARGAMRGPWGHGGVPRKPRGASAATNPRSRYAPPRAGFFCPVASLHSLSDASASHFEVCLATGQNNPGQMVPINPDPL